MKWINQNKKIWQVQNQNSRHHFVNVTESTSIKGDVLSWELRKIRLILITYSCNHPVNPILVCIGTFGQYKSHFHCSPHLFCIWTLKTYFIIQIYELCKAISDKIDFLFTRAICKAIPIGIALAGSRFITNPMCMTVFLGWTRIDWKEEYQYSLFSLLFCHCFTKITYAVTLKAILFYRIKSTAISSIKLAWYVIVDIITWPVGYPFL